MEYAGFTLVVGARFSQDLPLQARIASIFVHRYDEFERQRQEL